jgi:hypothetical protein
MGRRPAGMRVLSERLVRRTVRAVVRFPSGHSAERRHCRWRTSEQSERIAGRPGSEAHSRSGKDVIAERVQSHTDHLLG